MSNSIILYQQQARINSRLTLLAVNTGNRSRGRGLTRHGSYQKQIVDLVVAQSTARKVSVGLGSIEINW